MVPSIRTITLAIGDPHPLGEETIERAATFLREAQAQAEAAGYTVQTTRIATRPLLEDMAAADDARIVEYARLLQNQCEARGLAFCSLGPAPAATVDFPVERIALLPRLLAQSACLNATVQLATSELAPCFDAALATALAMRELAARGGADANFRFAAVACAAPGGPFFPQAYASPGIWQVSVGLQSAGIVRRAIEEVATRSGTSPARGAEMSGAVRSSLTETATPIVKLARRLARRASFRFGGIDLSPAPLGEESIVDAIEAAHVGRFGAPGTLAVAAALTQGMRSTSLPTCGYTGLMLPVLEDRTLGLRCAEGLVSVQSLLAYSAVCGTGLDTVPIPGDLPPERIAALLLDVASLAYRLRKPLSARLFLVPGGRPGEMTSFTSPYLTNTRILPVE
jgi:uncharacterized protein (UPF0210 family)